MVEETKNAGAAGAKPKLVAIEPRSSRNPRINKKAAASVSRVKTRRLLRSVALGTLALGAGVYYFAGQFGVDRQELLGYDGVSALLLLGLVVAAALAATLLRYLRR